MVLLRNLTLKPGEPEELLREGICRRYRLKDDAILSLRIVRKGLDARKKSDIRFVYTVEAAVADEDAFLARHASPPDCERAPLRTQHLLPSLSTTRRIVIAGMGPAGLFAALRLAEYGLSAVVLERGKPVAERVEDVGLLWRKGLLDPESNVQFGEGGAGTFSDGKLTTRVKDENCGWVLAQLAAFGAPAEIVFQAKPHIGTDRLRGVVAALREHLISRGFDIRFRTRLDDLLTTGGCLRAVATEREEIPCDFLVLAPGHSARDTYAMLAARGIRLEPKPFAIGVRVEHPQELIDRIQYGLPAGPHLPPADYALTYNDPSTGRSAYSFCMCPGGVVVAGASEEGGVVTNGMSPHARNAAGANSALVVSVGPDDFPGKGALAGIEFQRQWERRAFEAGGGGYKAPAQNLMGFLGSAGSRGISSSYLPGVTECDLATALPSFVAETLRQALPHFDRRMRGFVTGEATLTGVETRTSAPLRIVRGDDLQSVSLSGLYPAGEGAGYAGGIMSAALDGIRIADAIARRIGVENANR